MLITSTHYNRPECTKQMIQHLLKCYNIQQYKVLFFVEPGCQEVIDIINKYPYKHSITINSNLLGLWENKKQAVYSGLEESDCILHLEDDILLSTDALIYFDWCNRTYRNNNNVFSVTAYNQNNAGPAFEVAHRPHYTPWAWMSWSHILTPIKDIWSGHDHHLNELRKNKCEMFPCISRANNIGFHSGVLSHKDLVDLLKSKNIHTTNNVIQTNDLNNEWVKLNDTTIKSRPDTYFYINNHYIQKWNSIITIGSFYDKGRCL